MNLNLLPKLIYNSGDQLVTFIEITLDEKHATVPLIFFWEQKKGYKIRSNQSLFTLVADRDRQRGGSGQCY